MKVKISAMVALVLLLAPAAFAGELADIERPEGQAELVLGVYDEQTASDTQVAREGEFLGAAVEGGAILADVDRPHAEEMA